MKKIKKPFKDFMASIDNLTITRKTSLLFFIMVIGMLFIGSFAHISLNRIKRDFDILYNKRMVPVIHLEKIKDIYTVNILDTLRDIESGLISIDDGESIILLAQELIEKDWSEYKTSFTIDERDWITNMVQSARLVNSKSGKDTKTLEDDMINVIEQKIIKINIY